MPADEDASGEKKFRFITGYLSEDEGRWIPEDDRPLIRAAAILRAGTAGYYAELRASLERLEAILKVPYGPFYREDVHEAVQKLRSVCLDNEAMAQEAEERISEAGYRLNKKGHLVSLPETPGSPPHHFGDLVWRVFCRMYPHPKHGGDWRKNNTEGLAPIRALLAPYFPAAWLRTGRLSDAVRYRS